MVALVLAVAVAACSGGSGSGALVSGARAHRSATSSGPALTSSLHTEEHARSDTGSDLFSGASDSGGTSGSGRATTTSASSHTTQAFADVGPGDFSSPSGNIGCYVDVGSGIRCDIRTRSWAPPPAPSSCQLDYGQGLMVSQGPATFTCAGDTVLGSSNVLPYGSVAQRGPFRCDSEESGMSCVDTQTGHGFVLSVQSYKLF
jgi:hypothetical protein